jgi:putative nucleotide binding protein
LSGQPPPSIQDTSGATTQTTPTSTTTTTTTSAHTPSPPPPTASAQSSTSTGQFSHGEHGQTRKYEEYAYVLDFTPRGKSITVRGREGVIIQAIGEERLTLLELLGIANATVDVGDRLYIGREGREKVSSVLGRLEYNDISQTAKNELPNIVEKIVVANEKRFVNYINVSQPITPRIHALELIPGIGKTYMMTIIKERDKRKFENFADLQTRVGLRDPAKLVAKRILEEVMGQARMNLFVRK